MPFLRRRFDATSVHRHSKEHDESVGVLSGIGCADGPPVPLLIERAGNPA